MEGYQSRRNITYQLISIINNYSELKNCDRMINIDVIARMRTSTVVEQ